MKLSICLLLAVAAAASADQGFYQQQYAAQSPPSGFGHYYDHRRPRPVRKQGWMSWLTGWTGANRRQGIAGVFGALGAIGPVIGVAAVVAGVALLGYVLSEANSSGRDLNSDEWEVNHSVWMDQLQKDFEDSWSIE